MTNMTGSKMSIFSHPGNITGYQITTRSFPYRGPYCPGQYGPRLHLRTIWVSLFQMSEVCNTQFNTWSFPYWPGYHPSTHIGSRLRLGPIWGSWDDNQANTEMPMCVCSGVRCCLFSLSSKICKMFVFLHFSGYQKL